MPLDARHPGGDRIPFPPARTTIPPELPPDAGAPPDASRPVFVLAFANDPANQAQYLAGLGEEHARLTALLTDTPPAGHAPRWDVVASPRTSLGSLLDLVQDQAIAGRSVALLHFAGHAGGDRLLMEGSAGPEVARAEGLAEFLKMHPGFGLVFLNACSTRGQVEALFEAGVPAVIATDFDVPDAVALEFSTRFYREFVAGRTLRSAYEAAVAAVQANDALRRVAQTRAVGGGGRARPAGEWPWALHIRPGNDQAAQWSLAEAIGDPLWGTPSPHLPLGPDGQPAYPESPYRHLDPFGADHVALFFGRRLETRQLHDAIVTRPAPVVLLHGVSGAGKSSLLEAGLLPRLERTGHVRYVRREATRALVETLAVQLGVDPALADDANALRAAWRAIEAAPVPGEDVPPGTARLTVILDQVEEAIAPDPTGALARAAGRASELERLAAVARGILDHPDAPRGALVLGFRKEWLAEVDAALGAVALPRTKLFLDRLSRRGIMEAVNGVAQLPELRAHYGLRIDEGTAGSLAEVIADDLLVDPDSPVAPTLQVLLSKMWAATTPGARVFSHTLYEGLRKDGVLLNDFIEQQLARLAQRLPEASAKGLVLDVLGFHVSALGDASRARTRAQREARYPAERHALVEQVVTEAAEARLLATSTPAPGERVSRLGHDTLAPYLRRRLSTSVAPVQRGQRVLDERGPEWEEGSTRRSTVIGEIDAAALERAAWPWWRRGLDRAWRLATWTVSAPWRWMVAVARGPAAMWRGTVRRYVWLRNLLSANSREGTDEAGHRWLDANDLRLVEAGLAWGRVPTRAEQRLIDASRAARGRALRLRRQVVGAFGVVAVVLALVLGQAWSAAERARLRGLIGWIQHQRTDPWVKRQLIRYLLPGDEPPGGLQAVSNALDVPAPLMSVHAGEEYDDDQLTGGAISDDGRVAVAWSSVGVVRVIHPDSATGVWEITTRDTLGVRDVALTGDGACLAIAREDGVVELHRVSDHERADSIRLAGGRTPVGVRFHDQRHWLAITEDSLAVLVQPLEKGGCARAARDTAWTIRVAGTTALKENVVTPLPQLGFIVHGASEERDPVAIFPDGRAQRFGTFADGRRERVAIPSGAQGYVVYGNMGASLFGPDAAGTFREQWRFSATTRFLQRASISADAGMTALLEQMADSFFVVSRTPSGAFDTRIVRTAGYRMTDVQFSPTGNRLVATAIDGSAHVWDTFFDPSFAHPLVFSTGGDASVHLALSRDGSRMLVVMPQVASVFPTAIARRERERVLPAANPGIGGIAMMADGRVLLAGGARLLAADSTLADAPVRGLEADVTGWLASGDGTHVALVDPSGVSVRRWQSPGTPVRTVPPPSLEPDSVPRMPLIALSANGQRAAYALGSRLWVERPGGGDTLSIPYGEITALAWMGTDSLLIGAEHGAQLLWDGAEASLFANAPDRVVALAGRPGVSAVASLDRRGTAMLAPSDLGVTSSLPVRWMTHERGAPVTAIAMSRDGHRVATGAADGTVRVWRAATGALLLEFHAGRERIGALTFDGAGDMVIAQGVGGTLVRWPVTWRALLAHVARVPANGCLTLSQRSLYLGEGFVRAAFGWGFCSED